jgi:hypothetical protein
MTHGLTEAHFLNMVASFLGPYYIALAIMNGLAALYLWRTGTGTTWFRIPFGPGRTIPITNSLVWLLVAFLFVCLSPIAASGNGSWMPSMPLAWREAINRNTGPVVYSTGTLALLAILFIFRRFFVRPAVAWTIWNLMLLFLGLSMTDRNFFEIVAKPDNVPIVMLVLLLSFFTWLATYRAVINDDRIDRGEPPLEALDNEKVLVWPDLVYTELICMIALTAFLIFWAIALPAPLEEAANPVKTPNPSKAPWYFLWLQELLTMFHPMVAGVTIPGMGLIVLGAAGYIDKNPSNKPEDRKFAIAMLTIFLMFWATLVIIGSFFRGEGFNFIFPWEQGVHEIFDL